MHKLLYVIDTLQTGGAEKSTLEIIKNLSKFEVSLCILSSANDDLIQEFEYTGVKIHRLSVKGRMWWRTGPHKLRALLDKEQFDIVHASLFKAEIVTRLAMKGSSAIQVGSFVNDSYSKERYLKLDWKSRQKLNFYRLIDKYTAKNVPHFISITNAIAKSNAKALALPDSRIKTIYRGRSIGDYQVIHPPYRKGEPFKVLMVARLLIRKGYLEAIAAMDLLTKQHANVQLTIAGEGHEQNIIKAKVSELGLNDNIHFLGTVTNVPELHTKSHAFLFPSHYEGQGGALVEAMFSAKPIIVSDIPVFKEQIENGRTGQLVPVFDASGIATAVEWTMNNYDEAIEMGRNARSFAEENFDIQKIAVKYQEYYLSLVNKKNAAN